ncbi:pimeloyl-ACP methyl ester carboxylesterase [Shimia isoporae]|uniref:Pimeloyl-ACP methyl ester carboxylesterase n=1 Tax=Shimia isoporae TaxID=647720 RepID=A0A4R1NSC6_9RHOB|nr:alpha/beta hydrolase [Shimia isoporae]TCL08158.1 pimeloyl-ACP methyl ester carboxylesterase [Shimia isoporae]
MQIKANGITLEYETHGPKDGVPLILIRGLGSQMIHWPAELYEGLAKRGYFVIRFDNRDVGLSQRCPHPDAPGDADDILALTQAGKPVTPAYQLTDMAKDVIGLMDALDIDTAHIFGISMGGGITQLLVNHHPDRLRSATIVMTAARPLVSVDQAATILPALLARPQDRATYVSGWVSEHATNGSPGFPMTEKEIRAEAELAFDRGVDADGINRQLLAVLNAPDQRATLARTTVSCQVIHGEDDALIPVDLGAEIASIIPNCPFHRIAGMGHIITPKLAPQIVDIVDGFISDRGL